MSIKHVAAAVITPAALTGITLSAGTASALVAPAHRAAGGAAQNMAGQHGAGKHMYRWFTVRPGDTLTSIAAAHHISWQALYATPPNYRRIPNPDVIAAGTALRLPKNPRMRAAQFPALEAKLQPPAAPAPAAPSQAGQSAAQASVQPTSVSTAGESAFEQCVALRESGNNPTEPDGLFGILPSTWHSLGYSGMAGQAPVSVQQAAFDKLYAEDGTSPWAPYDGC